MVCPPCPARALQLTAGEVEGAFTGAGIAEAPGAQGDPLRRRLGGDQPFVDQDALWVEQVEAYRTPAVAPVRRTVDPDHRRTVAVP
jgi:hypothetical protein